ncbi:MAG: YiiX/YebB-like N1pC/P60 family cysteine hydrolase [Thermoanaerobaculia bacterium]
MSNAVIAAILVLSLLSLPASAQAVPSGPPDVADLQSGDLLWPKKKGAYIPYRAVAVGKERDERKVWEAERDLYVASLKARPTLSDAERNRIRVIERMSFNAFRGVFADGQQPGKYVPYSAGAGVGHVAIVRIHDEVTVVEAMWGIGVREIPYAVWAAERKNHLVWHARLSEPEVERRHRIADEAARHIGAPYHFWNFDLTDDRGFYCSKLAWLATLRATGIALDGNADPDRLLWLSPKQLLKSEHIRVLQSPGDYGTE